GRNENFSNFDAYVFNETPGNPYANSAGRDSNIVASIGIRNAVNKSYTKEITANYNTNFLKDHNIDVTVGATEQKWFWDILSGGGSLYYLDPNLWNTPEQQVLSGGGLKLLEKRSLIGYIGRIDYKFADKYYITGTVRRDGSSRFAPDHRWGTFPAVALAWRITSEKFMTQKPNWLNDFKLRANWGQLGNDQGTRGWQYLSLLNPGISSPDYSVGSGNGNPFGSQVGGAFFPNFANTSLSWETLTTSGIGFDALLFNSTVTLSVEYYSKINKDIIQNVSPPPSTGIEYSTDINIGSVRNRGVEVQVGYNTKIGVVDFSFSGNFTTQKNEVIKLNDGVPVGDNIREGYDLGFIYGYKMGGIFQSEQEIDTWLENNSDAYTSIRPKPGDVYFVDVQGSPDALKPSAFNNTPDGIINSNDRTYLGKTIPGYYYGFNFNGSYKGFDLSVYFYGVGDVQKYNWMRAGGESMSSNGANQWATTLNHWTTSNPSSTIPRAVYGDPNGNGRTSSRFVEDAGFLRLQNIQLGYSLPKTMLHKTGFIDGVRIYISSVNLFTLTQWTGIDPENDFNPPARQFLFGLNASF
ncbi:MAG: SusC/RagA family TonB-linked outer membrane protein, partial [Panacibacter sp.]